ncbi:hypothetical protein HYT25_04935 [Candidatus Pacearchaeota archaeon]|nr:hypothetical protein [Candidatus Pacearchaeota archaeon]
MNQEIEEQKMEEYRSHLNGYLESPIVRNVLSQDTTFKDEVEDFYDLSNWEEWTPGRSGIPSMPYTEYDLGKENPNKRGTYPTNLVEIVESFSEDTFDVNKLKYEVVRKDYQRWNDSSRKGKRIALTLGGIIATVAGSVSGAPLFFYEKSLIGGILVTTGVVAGYYGLTRAMNLPAPKGTNNELWEYERLHETAQEADSFVDEHYRNYFIRKALETK